ncbi:MAG TPA: rhamnulokinase [Terracidiphilus sp.]|nr:rhamnulokinase [Terracidiphilus sp.]
MKAADSIETQFPSFAAVDLGASSGRVIAAQLRKGSLSLREVSRFSIAFSRDQQSGYLCWGIDAIEESVRKGIEDTSLLAPIASVGVDSWGVDFVLLDAELRRVGPAVCYRDDRTKGMIEQVTARMPRAEIYRRTGIQFMPLNTMFQLAAVVAREPEWVARTRHLLMIPDYFHFKLCGVIANEYTDATTTQLLNLDGEWDRDLFEAVGLKQIWMKPPVPAGTVLGEARFGNQTAKVVAGTTHDTASAVVGTPFEAETEAFISSGTWSLMGVESLVPYASELAMKWNFANEGGFGRRYRVLKNIMGLWLLQRLTQEFQIPIDDALLSAVAEAAPWRSIVNPDDARFLNPDSMKQAIAGYCKETGQPAPETPAQFGRCALESLALTYRLVKEQLESLRGQSLTRIRIVGGGSKNRLLNQLCANACQLPVSAGPVEASALGNICTQMIALGEIPSLDAARAVIRQSFEIIEYRPLEPIPDSVWNKFSNLLHRE